MTNMYTNIPKFMELGREEHTSVLEFSGSGLCFQFGTVL